MLIANKNFTSNYNLQTSSLEKSMTNLSTGKRLNKPSDAPADLGISERLKNQVRDAQEAGRVTQNAMNLLQSNDAWMQQVNDMLNRMSELAVAGNDSSKSPDDLANLDKEFQQLKQEISRISESSKYNGLQINGKTAIATYDTNSATIKYTQADGSDEREIEINLRSGNTSKNKINYCFETGVGGTTGDFLTINGGKDILYVAQQDDTANGVTAFQTVMKLNIATDTITKVDLDAAGAVTNANTQARLTQDEHGQIWVTSPSSGTAGAFKIEKLDTNSMTLDAGGVAGTSWAGDAQTAVGFSSFTKYDDQLYFIAQDVTDPTKINLSTQCASNANQKDVLIGDLAGKYGITTDYKLAFSPDGQYLAFTPPASPTGGTLNPGLKEGDICVIDTSSGAISTISVGKQVSSAAAIGFDANNKLYFTDAGDITNSNTVKKITISPGDTPMLSAPETIREGIFGELGVAGAAQGAIGLGLSCGGISPASQKIFQVGPNKGMELEIEAADFRLTRLGISSDNLKTMDSSRIAIEHTQEAINRVISQRAEIGAQLSRLEFTYAGNEQYINNTSAAESRIRDADMAKESAEMARQQIKQQASLSMLTQVNQSNQGIMRLFQ